MLTRLIPRALISRAPDANARRGEIHLPGQDEEAKSKARELLARAPACHLVTGYRGVGKSTFLDLVASHARALQPHIVFVHVNGAISGADEDRSRLLLRKMQRNLYETLVQTNTLRRLPRNLRTELRLAFLQTTHTVRDATTTTSELSATVAGKDWAKSGLAWAIWAAILEAAPALGTVADRLAGHTSALLRMGGTLLSIFPGVAGLLKSAGNVIHLSYEITALIAAAVAALGLEVAVGSLTRKREREIATLYDDEVAETTFINLLGRLRATPLKLVFVVDELDKLTGDRLLSLIEGLKPILMCSHAHFLLVTGMDDYLRWHNGMAKDDDAFVNLFHSQFVVPALRDDDLKILFGHLLADEGPHNQATSDFLDDLTMESLGRPRRFISELHRAMRWGARPELTFTGRQRSRVQFGARLYSLVREAWRRSLDEWSNVPPAVVEILRTWTVQWVRQMTARAPGTFSAQGILSDAAFPLPEYQGHAQKLLEELLGGMIEAGLLTKPDEQYAWSDSKAAHEYAYGVSPAELGRAVPSDQAADAATLLRLLSRIGEARQLPMRKGIAPGQLLTMLAARFPDLAPSCEKLISLVEQGRLPDAISPAIRLLEAEVKRILTEMPGMTVARDRTGFDLVLQDSDGRRHAVDFWLAWTGVTTRTLQHWIRSLYQSLSSDLQVQSVLVLAINFADLPISDRALQTSKNIWKALPVQGRLAVAASCDPAAIRAAIAAPLLERPAGKKPLLTAWAGNGFVHLNWNPEGIRLAVIKRSDLARPAEQPVTLPLPTNAVGEYTDMTIENGQVYHYQLFDAGRHAWAIGSTLAVPHGQRPGRDVRLWRTYLTEAAGAAVPSKPRLPAVAPLADITKLLTAQEEAAGAPWPRATAPAMQAAVAMGLVRINDGAPALTREGRDAARQFRYNPEQGKAPDALVMALVRHPALQQLLQQLRRDGAVQTTALRQYLWQRMEYEREWLWQVATWTGAFRVEGTTVYWDDATLASVAASQAPPEVM